MKKLYLGILFIVITLSSIAQKASLKGNVSDKITGETIVGASVIIEGTTIGAMTDFDGNFQINNIPSGTHTIICSFISYEPEKLEEISFKPGESKENNFLLGEAVVQVAEVNVIARVSRETEALLLMEQKEAEGIKESIGARRLSRLGVSDAAAATSKISGVTKNESTGDIYIRGLGDRYLTSTMNGLPIPSDDVEKKNIDLNLFSTDIIKNVGINKTYAVESYADQSSGAVDVGSKNYAENIELDFSTGSNTNIFQN
ncbi:MAG: carboxypeptidase-like regulatory domain-containing protein [Prolixibacteraceae bacterium]|nr:carboxypeptidase-like regulatory domain-containing protein [Prolixibacteraceae bacterium]